MNLSEILGNASFFAQLYRLDVELAERHQSQACPSCGSTLHQGFYQRKPRGALYQFPQSYAIRHSYCCSVCRKRSLPPSCLFFGRRIYFGCFILFATAILQGLTSQSMMSLCTMLQISKRTLRRWLLFFKEAFPKSIQWQRLRGLLPPAVAASPMPLGLLQSYSTISLTKGLFETCCLLVRGISNIKQAD